jgi:hypothetical protein
VASDHYGSILSTSSGRGGLTFHACARAGGAPVTLGSSRCLSLGGNGEGASLLRLDGPFVGYAATLCGIDSSAASVRVLDLRRRKFVLDAGAIGPPIGPETEQSVRSLKLRADGAAAWVGEGQSLAARSTKRELWAADSRHRSRRLDSGAAIVPSSLELTSRTVSWRNGSTARSASLR